MLDKLLRNDEKNSEKTRQVAPGAGFTTPLRLTKAGRPD